MRFCILSFLWVGLLPELVEGEGEIPLFNVNQIEAIRAAEGQTIRVRGLIERTGKSKGTGMNFLNFKGGELTIVVFGRSLKNFPKGEPADHFTWKRVQVTGKLEFYKEKPQIVLERPSNVILLDNQTGEPVKSTERKGTVIPEKTSAAPNFDASEKKKTSRVKVDPRIYFDDP